MTDARKALESAREALENISMMHDGNPPLAIADMPDIDYARRTIPAMRRQAREPLAAIDAVLASGEQPVAYIERSVLAHLAADKHATATVCSGLLRAPFGDPVALFTTPAAAPPAPETRT